MYRSFVLLVCMFIGFQYAHASEITARFYSEDGAGGVTSDGRTFEDRYTDWGMTVSSPSARIAGSDEDTKHQLRNMVGNGNGYNYYSLGRSFLSFDTSTVPDNAELLSAVLFLHGDISMEDSIKEYENVYVTEAYPADAGKITVNDHNKVGNTVFASTYGWNDMSWNKLILNESGGKYIKINGITTFALRGWYDISQLPPTNETEISLTYFVSENSGIDKDPYLEIT